MTKRKYVSKKRVPVPVTVDRTPSVEEIRAASYNEKHAYLVGPDGMSIMVPLFKVDKFGKVLNENKYHTAWEPKRKLIQSYIDDIIEMSDEPITTIYVVRVGNEDNRFVGLIGLPGGGKLRV